MSLTTHITVHKPLPSVVLTRFDHLRFLGVLDDRPGLAAWYQRIQARPNYDPALRDWFNPKYLPLMAEKGDQAWPQVRDIIGARRQAITTAR